VTNPPDPGNEEEPAEVDITIPHSARVWNYLLGGKDNFAVDRAAADQFIAMFPPILDIARADRAFLRRAVRYLTGTAGVRQFLDIGTGLPTMDNTHEVAQRVAPDSRIVYVDNDPMVLAHARALLTSSPQGACSYIDADLQEPASIVERASATLDFGKPVAIMLLGIVHFILDTGAALDIVGQLLDSVPSGSYLVITHATLDFDEGSTAQAEAQEDWNNESANPLVPRTRQEIARFFDGLEVLDPGIVSMSQWRPDNGGQPAPVPGYCVIGRKP
jgi:hypothetical protein